MVLADIFLCSLVSLKIFICAYNQLSKMDTVGTGLKCPSKRELSYSEMTEQSHHRDQHNVSIKRELTVYIIYTAVYTCTN